ncbi:hypothetical protein [Caenimonas sp. SL110]|uniref:hypothetical protein n=1 Tax=Caenimonas sp. SL110 TaxID=1450524 RepID=UPI0006546009|nr:hypothetical protein [Caenimonas sp. SL110]
MRHLFAGALALVLCWSAMGASGAQFGSAPSPRGESLRLACPASELLHADCSLAGIGKDGKQAYPATAMKFTEATLQTQVLQQVALAKRDSPVVGDIAMDAQSVDRLAAIDWERCLESKQMGRDAVLCAPAGQQPEWAVLFLRGKCERCKFEPIVLKKE